MIKKLSLLLVIAVSSAYADGIKALDLFLQNKNSSISADFVQTVYGVNKNKISQGRMEISRPNKFRWIYLNDGQEIISNSKMIYVYDKQLKQVTQKPLNGSLGKSPASLLAGGSNIKQIYDISNLPESNGIEWVLLKSKNVEDNNGFKSIQMGFNKKTGELSQMNFVDSFDNKSTISFSNVKTGVKFSKDEFDFLVPKDVDVIKN